MDFGLPSCALRFGGTHRARLEIRLKDGFEHQFQACLDHPVGDGGEIPVRNFPVLPLGRMHMLQTSSGRSSLVLVSP